jgi:hypothetical protein
MVACPLCVLGIPQERHTPRAWIEFAQNENWQAIFALYCKENKVDLAGEAMLAEAAEAQLRAEQEEEAGE